MSDATERNEAETKAAEAVEATEPKEEGKAAQAESKAAEGKPARRFKKSAPKAADVARSYFEAMGASDLEAAAKHWAPDIVERIAPVGELRGPDEVRAFFQELFTAFPDQRMEVLDLVAAGNQVAVRWRSTGTFCGAPFQGIDPTGARIELEGIDLLTIEDGLIQRNDAYYDGTQFARQIGMLPPRDSTAERGMTAAFNARTRLGRTLFTPSKEQVAEGVWLVRGGFPMKTMNVYLIEDDGGVTVFDAGIKAMTSGIASAGAARWAGSSEWCSATVTATTGERPRGSARRSSATPTRSPTPRETAASTTSTSRSSVDTLARADAAAARAAGTAAR